MIQMKAVVTVIGKDKKGIIAKVSAVLFENGVNILDISQTVMEDFFAMVMLADIGTISVPFSELKNRLENAGKDIGMEIRIQREEIFSAMHRI